MMPSNLMDFIVLNLSEIVLKKPCCTVGWQQGHFGGKRPPEGKKCLRVDSSAVALFVQIACVGMAIIQPLCWQLGAVLLTKSGLVLRRFWG